MEKKEFTFGFRFGLFLRRLRQMHISVYASHACFFIVLSLFPALVLMLGILRFTTLEPGDLMSLMEGILPQALEPYLWKLISSAYEHTSRVVVSVSGLTALWSASRGVHGLVRGLNVIYDVEEHRNWLQIRLMSAFYTVLFLMVLILTLILHVFGNSILQLVIPRMPWLGRWMGLLDLRYFLLVFVLTLMFVTMYVFLPNRRSGFRANLPGALFATFGWMTASSLFSIYVEYFSTYTTIYGSVYAVALSMLWLYVCVCILFYGGIINRLLQQWR